MFADHPRLPTGHGALPTSPLTEEGAEVAVQLAILTADGPTGAHQTTAAPSVSRSGRRLSRLPILCETVSLLAKVPQLSAEGPGKVCSVTLVWVTGNSGVGKSTVCALLQGRGRLAVDADWEGYSHWEDRTSGQVAADPPYPVPVGWLDRFAWKISRAKVESLAVASHEEAAFLCGSVENEDEVRDLFDLVICMVVDAETLRHRLQTRTTNAFGANPEELAAALRWNGGQAAAYRRLGATIVDASRPPADVVDAVLAATAKGAQVQRPG